MKLVYVIISFIVITSCSPVVTDSYRPDHHGDNVFKNPYNEHKHEKGIFSVWKMHNDEERVDWDGQESKVPVKFPDIALINSNDSIPRMTWIGQSSFLIQAGGKNILTDPVFSRRASPVSFAGPERIHEPGIEIKDLPRIDLVLISHDHYDHLDKDFIKKMAFKTIFIVPAGLKKKLNKWGVPDYNIREFDWDWKLKIKGIQISATSVQHFSGRTLWDRNETLWAGYSVNINGFSFWFAGDTGYNDVQFKEIGKKFGKFDLAIIPVGAYKPRWFMKDMHVNPEEAVVIHKEINSKLSVGGHWGTFQLSSEPIDEPLKDLKAAKVIHNIPEGEFITLSIGETVIIK